MSNVKLIKHQTPLWLNSNIQIHSPCDSQQQTSSFCMCFINQNCLARRHYHSLIVTFGRLAKYISDYLQQILKKEYVHSEFSYRLYRWLNLVCDVCGGILVSRCWQYHSRFCCLLDNFLIMYNTISSAMCTICELAHEIYLYKYPNKLY